MDASAEWVMAWMDLILDSTALREAARHGDIEAVRLGAHSIAVRAKRHGFHSLSHKAASLVGQLRSEVDAPPSAYAQSVEEIARQVDSIGRERGG
jgi:hypothetical protein